MHFAASDRYNPTLARVSRSNLDLGCGHTKGLAAPPDLILETSSLRTREGQEGISRVLPRLLQVPPT